MFRIVICMGEAQKSYKLFHLTQEIIKKLKIKCELSYCVNNETVRQNMANDSQFYDVLLLDACDKECLITAKQLRENNLIGSIIFVSDLKKKLSNILQYRPSFLITNFEENKQLESAIRFVYEEQIRAHPYFTVRNRDGLIRIPYNSILWFESNQRIVTLHTEKRTIRFYAKLTDVQNSLPKGRFIRCHQSYIVNFDIIESLDKVNHCLYTKTGDRIEISKSCYTQVIELFDSFL